MLEFAIIVSGVSLFE